MAENGEPVTFLGKENSHGSSSVNARTILAPSHSGSPWSNCCKLLLIRHIAVARAVSDKEERGEQEGEGDTTSTEEGYEVPSGSGKVGGGIRFDSIIVRRNQRDRIIVE